MNEIEKRLLDSATIDHAWPLVELFSTIRREHPDDCNRAAQHLVDRLKALGVPVKIHEPQLYLALPAGRPCRLRRPQAVRAARAAEQARAGRRHRSAGVCRQAGQSAARLGSGERRSVRRQLRPGTGHARPCRQDRRAIRHDLVGTGDGGGDARRSRHCLRQSRRVRALGRRQLHVGHGRRRGPALQARYPVGCGQQRRRQGAHCACGERRQRHHRHKVRDRLVP